MLKKQMCLVMIMAMVLTMFSGCSQETNSVEEKDTAVAVEENSAIEEGTEKTEAVEGEKLKIAFVANSFADKYQTYLHDSAKARAEELGVDLVFSDAKADSATQLANLENMLIEGVDAVILLIVDSTAPGPLVSACNDANVPLIGVNNYFEGYDTYVGSRNIESGILEMEAVAEILNFEGNIAIMHGMSGHEAEILRTEGNKQIIDQYEGLQVVREDVANWDRAKGMEIMENWLTSGADIDAVVCNNDEMAIGSIRAIKAVDRLDDFIIAGVDATADALDYVKTGELDVTVFQNPFAQGAGSVDAAIAMAKGETIEKEVWVPFEVVDINNVDEYLKLWKEME